MARAGSLPQKGRAMSLDDPSRLSSQEEGKRFDLLATDATEYAVFLVGLDGKLLRWNAGAEGLVGYHSSEIIGQHFSRFFTPENIVTGQPEHELKTAAADGRTKNTRWQVRKDGTRFLCRATGRRTFLLKFVDCYSHLTEVPASRGRERIRDSATD